MDFSDVSKRQSRAHQLMIGTSSSYVYTVFAHGFDKAEFSWMSRLKHGEVGDTIMHGGPRGTCDTGAEGAVRT
jgi:hypothetical protein